MSEICTRFVMWTVINVEVNFNLINFNAEVPTFFEDEQHEISTMRCGKKYFTKGSPSDNCYLYLTEHR